MPLVHRDESPTTGLCARAHHVDPPACGKSVCSGRAPATAARSTLQPERPQELVCVCARTCRPSMSSLLVTRPCTPTSNRLSAGRQAGGQIGPPPDVRAPSLRRLLSRSDDHAHLTWFMQWHRVGSWKPQAEMTVQNKNELGS